MSIPKIVTYQRKGAVGRLRLQGIADIFEAADIHGAAVTALGDTRAVKVAVDLTALERMDLSTMQILSCLKRDLESNGRSLELNNLSAFEAAKWKRIGFAL